MTSTDSMRCISCNRDVQYPDGFPDRTFAECWECAWIQHMVREHPKVLKKIRAKAMKKFRARALSVTNAELREFVFGTDRKILDAADRIKRGES